MPEPCVVDLLLRGYLQAHFGDPSFGLGKLDVRLSFGGKMSLDRVGRASFEVRRDQHSARVVVVPFADEVLETLWRGIVTACSGRDVSVRLYVNDRECVGRFAELLPSKNSGSLAEYAEAMDGWFDSWALVVNSPQHLDAALYASAVDFLREVAEQIPGDRWQFADIDAFVGRYTSTPFGVHFDNASNVMVPVAGSPKTMWTWPTPPDIRSEGDHMPLDEGSRLPRGSDLSRRCHEGQGMHAGHARERLRG